MSGRFSKIIYERYKEQLDEVINNHIISKFDSSKIIDLKYHGATEIFANKDKIYFNVRYRYKNILYKDLFGNMIERNCYIHCNCKIDDDIYEFNYKNLVSDETQTLPDEKGLVEYTDDLIPKDKKYPMYSDVDLLFDEYDNARTAIEGVRVNIYKLARLIGLKVYDSFAFEDKENSAKICFFKTRLLVVNTETNKIEEHEFEKGSIILNKYYVDERGPKSANFAIAHEIYHWVRHKYYVVLKHLSQCSGLFHTTIIRTKFFWRNNDERIEVQANKFAGTILLQDKSLYNNFLIEINNRNYAFDETNREKIIDVILNNYSDLYKVSKKTIAIIISSASKDSENFEELNKYKNDFAQEYSHYEIYENDFIKLFLYDDKFHQYIIDNKLVYVKKRVVLNVKEAIINGHITKLARDNPEKYFVNFSINYSCVGLSLSTVLNSNNYKRGISIDKDKNSEIIKRIIDEYIINEDAKKFENESFSNQLLRYRERGKFRQEDLIEIGFTTQSISAYENGKEKPILDNLVKLIIFYKLTPNEVKNLMKAGGYSFNNSERERLMEYLVSYKKATSIEEINQCLKRMNFDELKTRIK